MRVGILASVVLWILILTLTGCAGFTVQFGIHEVNETVKTEKLVNKEK